MYHLLSRKLDDTTITLFFQCWECWCTMRQFCNSLCIFKYFGPCTKRKVMQSCCYSGWKWTRSLKGFQKNSLSYFLHRFNCFKFIAWIICAHYRKIRSFRLKEEQKEYAYFIILSFQRKPLVTLGHVSFWILPMPLFVIYYFPRKWELSEFTLSFIKIAIRKAVTA